MQEQRASISMAANIHLIDEGCLSTALQINVEGEERTFTEENPHLEVDILQETFKCLLDCVKDEVNHANQDLPSIYMAPHTLRDKHESSFNPRIVSIGPLHRKDTNVQAFEKRKIIHLIKLMRRTNLPLEEVLMSCVQKVCSSMDRIKACYVSTSTKDYNDHVIAKMMLMDACFILDFIYWHSLSLSEESYRGNMLPDRNIMYDLVLLENQIPLFVLDQIFQCTILTNDSHTSLVNYFFKLLNNLSLFDSKIQIPNISIHTTPHILSLLHKCYKPQIYATPGDFSPRYSVVDLDRAGVNFEPNKDPPWEMQMKVKLPWCTCFYGFWNKPTLELPVLRVDDFTELIFRNLIAYEHLFQTQSYVTSYAYAMDMLVNSQEDVAMLVDKKVLVNSIGSNEEAAKMINIIAKQVECVDFFYDKEWETLNDYCGRYWPKHIAWLRRTYFSSPWSLIALIVGIIIFALTLVQTIYTITSASSNK